MNSPKNPKNENILLNLFLNIVLPTIILMKFSGDEYLGTRLGVVVALSFPIGYGLYDFTRTEKINFYSVLGVISVAITGAMTLLELPLKYYAIKEATIPTIFGLVVLGSLKTPYPIVKKFVYNDSVFDVKHIEDALKKFGNEIAFQKALSVTSYLLAGSFFLSAVLNYGLAKYILKSAPGTEAFNIELGKMTALSYPVITIPSLIVLIGAAFYLFRSIKRLTQLTFEDIFVSVEAEEEDSKKDQSSVD